MVLDIYNQSGTSETGTGKDEKYKAELLKSAKKAEAANEAKTEFLQRMSHDIRTPINGICGMIDVAEHYADDMENRQNAGQRSKKHLICYWN